MNESYISNLLTQAVTRHQANQLAEAQTLYQQLLQQDPHNINALHLLGVCVFQQGNPQAGAQFIEQAIAINPNIPEFHINLATTLHSLKKLEVALAHLKQAIGLDPNNAEPHFNLGNLLVEQNKYDESILAYETAISLKPTHWAAHNNLGNVFQKLEKHLQAIEHYKIVLLHNPHNTGTLYNIAYSLIAIEKIDEASRYVLEVAKYKPDDPLIFKFLGICSHKLNKVDEAVSYYKKSIELTPHSANVYYNLGVALSQRNLHHEAIEAYQQAINVDPQYQKAYFNLGNAFNKLHQFNDALKYFNQSLAIEENDIDVLTNRAHAFMHLHRLQEAFTDYKTISEIDPTWKFNDWNKSLCQLHMGDYKNGFKNYESRWETIETHRKRNFTQPLWLGEEPLQGKSIFLYIEQGFGDAIQFLRYVEKVVSLGAHVFLGIPPSLKPVVAYMEDKMAVTIVVAGELLPEFDYQCPLMSLALAFKTEINTIPCDNIPYCLAKKTSIAKWAKKLSNYSKPKIGIAWWSSNKANELNHRYIPLKQLISVIPTDYSIISLQKEINAEDAQWLEQRSHILHFEDEMADFGDTAALIENMDLIISIDTSVAHLAGAMGKPLWLLLPYNTDWRWMIDRTDSLWYPTARLFRQPQIGDWESVIRTVKKGLDEYKNKIA